MKIFHGLAIALLSLFVLSACGSGSSDSGNNASPVGVTTNNGLVGLWQVRTISGRGLGTNIPVPPGDMYFNFSGLTSSTLVVSFYSKSRTANCLLRTGPGTLRLTGENQYVDAAGDSATLVVDSVQNRLNAILSALGTVLTLDAERTDAIRVEDLQLCTDTMSRSEDSSHAVLRQSIQRISQ